MMMNSCIDRDARLACQYTYNRIGTGMIAHADSTTAVYIATVIPKMRVAPTVTLLSDVKIRIGGATKTSSGSSILALSYTNAVHVNVDGFTGLTVGQAGSILENAAGSSPWVLALDAELL